MSLSQVDISGDESERPLVPPCDPSGKGELENFPCLSFVAEIGDPLSRRMFPSEKDLLKNDLKIQK